MYTNKYIRYIQKSNNSTFHFSSHNFNNLVYQSVPIYKCIHINIKLCYTVIDWREVIFF